MLSSNPHHMATGRPDGLEASVVGAGMAAIGRHLQVLTIDPLSLIGRALAKSEGSGRPQEANSDCIPVALSRA